MTLTTKCSYWLRNVGGSFSVFSHAGVAASEKHTEVPFLPALLRLHHAGEEFSPSQKQPLTRVTQATSVTRNTAI